MHGGIRVRLAVLLATLITCASSALAQTLNSPALGPADGPVPVAAPEQVYRTPPTTATGQLISNSTAAPDLAAELAEIKAELKKIKDKEADAKKKAAGMPSVKASGRIHTDWGLFGQGAGSRGVYGDVQDGMEFRRARIGLSGDAFEVVDYKIEMDFADTDTGAGPAIRVNDSTGAQLEDVNGNPVNVVTTTKTIQSTAFKDVYMTVKELPYIGHVRVGHFKEPFGLEQLESTNFLTFMERSLGDEGAFVPGRRMGVMAFDNWAGENGLWAIGAFRSEQTNGAEPPFRMDDDGGTAMTARLTYLPWFDEATDGRGLIHTGIAYSYRNIDDGTVRLQQRPEAHLGPFVVDTGNITHVPEVQLLGLEAAFVYGPFSVQTEYYSEWIPRTGGLGTAYLNGYYAYASYFLTGENRYYRRDRGTFDRVKPFTNFFRVRTNDGVQTGCGAWELAYRYSTIDLVDLSAGVNGGFADDHTLGLNWYLNPYTRLMWNYVLCRSTPEAGVDALTDMSVFEMRAQIDF